jgi:hypothetical protein
MVVWTRVDAQLLEDVADVLLDGVLGDDEFGGDTARTQDGHIRNEMRDA